MRRAAGGVEEARGGGWEQEGGWLRRILERGRGGQWKSEAAPARNWMGQGGWEVLDALGSARASHYIRGARAPVTQTTARSWPGRP